jgi:hypothetical protein
MRHQEILDRIYNPGQSAALPTALRPVLKLCRQENFNLRSLSKRIARLHFHYCGGNI